MQFELKIVCATPEEYDRLVVALQGAGIVAGTRPASAPVKKSAEELDVKKPAAEKKKKKAPEPELEDDEDDDMFDEVEDAADDAEDDETDEVPETDEDDEDETPAAEPVAEKKKGRGRPPKDDGAKKAAATSSGKTPKFDLDKHIVPAFKAFHAAQGRDASLALLKKFDASSVRAISPDRFPEFMKKLKAA